MSQSATTPTGLIDPLAGIRKHVLLPQSVAKRIPPLMAQDGSDDPMVYAKFFSPWTGWTWYVTELDPQTGEAFGLVEGFEKEKGYFHVPELASVTLMGGVPAIERDKWFTPCLLSEVAA